MKLALFPIAATALLLAACSSAPTETAATSGDLTTTETSGLSATATPGTQADLEQNVGDRVLFGFDSTVLDEEARSILQRQAAWFQQFGTVAATIEGHTDERGTREYNLALGERRATAAARYLESLGVSGSRLTTISYGKDRPADPGSDETAWAQNRRAVTVVNATN
ncbi:MAG TPA: peptidoglycan-associated lipoprotein Pal [Geminicoccus sp.]|jgi:peptidoglycan-associated lipoprotein|uniref:peptidoglycan-associated lipoprotein Pal n=1 Tax=Geminicoccus sp. TaxID=2024832 RepID=UPI002E3591F3|nr:peptidoglycan-associated lipoprotein Pal [Geminicoccus sp.]HEX2528094.1 peptidoglycan-associated lipoprotein Pal [Geminicoccus sp.]